ncbi:uncharacterized protein NEMAJ01_1920 [Nematocida major]|uniref:uncharacterized protein n=1 Tax=Nematocida major TaxID=1912982 RepID=UPI0020087DC6|nr:uncharacterized protein NEMAJ01_1920 [Nematocida major]KAH9387024.1 hypothetical protein NEMAJ01_1920 [Nematocida major]
MIPTVPSFIIRRAIKKESARDLNGMQEVALTGKIIRRTKNSSVLFDSFSGIRIQTNSAVLQGEIDKSIFENYPVHVLCTLERIPKLALHVKSVRRCSFHEEMYNTLEGIEYWKKVQSQKQPK